jgi:YVTN family beta-propeller protein
VVRIHNLVFALLGLAVVAAAGGCNFGQSGIEPPADRIFLPAGIAVDPEAPLLYVVNSNSDLRFNAGTVAVVDLSRAYAMAANGAASPYPICGKTRFSRTEEVPGDYCCRDAVDSRITNCAEPQFIQAEATVALGSFGGTVRLQRFVRQDGETVRRLFVAVRAEPSITFADVTVSAGRASIRCTGPRRGGAPQAAGAYCDDGWRVRRPSGVTPGALVLPEEPHTLRLDETHGILYAGHLTLVANKQVQGGGVSTIDVCNPADDRSVRFAGLARTTFLPASASQAVAALSPGDPADAAIPVYATARYSATISGMALRSPEEEACDVTAPARERDLTLVPAESFLSPAFLPRGADIRGILFLDGDDGRRGGKAVVLHRNSSESIADPPALVVLDRARRPDGTVPNTPLAVLEICNGPTGMQLHDAGRGQRIYVTCYDDGQIYVVEPDRLAVVATIDVGAGPTSLVFPAREPGFAYVASFANSHLSLIDLNPGSPTENHVVLRIGLPHGYGE